MIYESTSLVRVTGSLLMAGAAALCACGGGQSMSAVAAQDTSDPAIPSTPVTPPTTPTTPTTPTAPTTPTTPGTPTTPTTPPTTPAPGTMPPATPVAMPGAPTINPAAIPKGSNGVGVDMIGPTADLGTPSSMGAFRTLCDYSHMSFDDPIVYPGQPGRSHLHTFFGNTATDASSTAGSIAGSGNSTCRGGTVNRSAYWTPAMIDTKDGTPLKPKSIIVYYKVGDGANPADITPFPPGLRMIAGDMSASEPVQWGPTGFTCGGNAVASDANFPALPSPHSIPNCPVGTDVWASIQFPTCWDGQNLDSPDHRSHMAYRPIPNPSGKCPASHPIAVPAIAFQVMYPVTEAGAPLRWRLSSDSYDRSIPAGYSLHGDWFNGWKPEIMNAWVEHCDRQSKDCGAHLLGDGRLMLF